MICRTIVRRDYGCGDVDSARERFDLGKIEARRSGVAHKQCNVRTSPPRPYRRFFGSLLLRLNN